MGLVIVGIMAVISILVSIFIIVRKQSKGDIRLQVEAICEGKNELDQAIMRIYFTFSIGKLASRSKEIIGSIDWSEGWMPVSYNLKEHGSYQEERIPTLTEDKYTTFEIDATNAIDDQGSGEGYVVLVLEKPTQTMLSRAGVMLVVTANLVSYQLSDSISWHNEVIVNHI
ncbi:hypothetical protein FC756_09405 [Lysinibacillus mangiferihumi]|uniref:Uncharacterized protein n=1 Tax=Lysinibacillus mangiferihumi TaxID=1130819 RepID=A0A4U2Z4J4_9BACI|nr:hypothetical protein [Lysinibacillus mangiferihumi]TKI69176.1 hypothetical protein FC756_09405 [Lysinibacillus mangiferihumi]